MLAVLFTIGNSVFNNGDGSTQNTDENIKTEEVSDDNTKNDLTDIKSEESQIATDKDSETVENLEEDQKVYTNDRI